MFKLKNAENNICLVLSVDGYQFPDHPKDDWCLINLAVEQGEKRFQVVDPALEATSFRKMLVWFEDLSVQRLPRFAKLDFVEPCLEFEFVSCDKETVRISLNLSCEMTPDFELEQFGISDKNCNIIFDLDADGFKSVIAGVKQAISQYPVRSKS